jgi:AraC-like DNA-binding protein
MKTNLTIGSRPSVQPIKVTTNQIMNVVRQRLKIRNVNAERSIRLIRMTPQIINKVACKVGFKRTDIFKRGCSISITFEF